MAKRLSFEVLIRTALLGAVPDGGKAPTKTELSKRLGVSRRTVGRWLNGESKPRVDYAGRIDKVLRTEYKRVRAAAKRINRHFDAEPPEQLIPIAGERRTIAERDAYGDATGRMIASDWVNYDMSGYDIRAMFDFLRGLRALERVIQIIYSIPAGGTSLGGREYRGSSRGATSPIQLHSEMGDAELWEETLGPIGDHQGKALRVLFVAVLEA